MWSDGATRISITPELPRNGNDPLNNSIHNDGVTDFSIEAICGTG